MPVKTLMFPEYLGEPEYKFRKFTINVLESKTFAKGIKEALGLISDKQSDISKLASSESSDDIVEILSNLKENTASSKNADTIMSIVLPLPNSFTDSTSHQWSTKKGIIGEAGEAMESTSLMGLLPNHLRKGIENSSIVGFAKDMLPGFVSNAGSAIAGYKIGAALGEFSEASGMRKPLIDPGYFQNYTGTDPRTFSFSFDLIPRNAKEAKTMIEILLKLKEYSSPEMSSNGVSMLAPHFFDVAISNPVISGVANMNGVVLRSINIDYSADGFMQQTTDGIPKHIKLDLQFVERRMQVAGDFRKKGK